MNIHQSVSQQRVTIPVFGLFCSMLLLGCSTPPGYYDESDGMAFNAVEPYWAYEREVYLMPPYQPYPSDYYPRYQVADESSSWNAERRRNARPMPMPTVPPNDSPSANWQESVTPNRQMLNNEPGQRPTFDSMPRALPGSEPANPSYH